MKNTLKIFILLLITVTMPTYAASKCYLCSGEYKWLDQNDSTTQLCQLSTTITSESSCSGYIEKVCNYGSFKINQSKTGELTTDHSKGIARVYNFSTCPSEIYDQDNLRGCSLPKSGLTTTKNAGGCVTRGTYSLSSDDSPTPAGNTTPDTPTNNYVDLNCKYYDKNNNIALILTQTTSGTLKLTDGSGAALSKTDAITGSGKSYTSCPGTIYKERGGHGSCGIDTYKLSSGAGCNKDTYTINKQESEQPEYDYPEYTCQYQNGLVIKQDKTGKNTITINGVEVDQSKVHIEKHMSSDCPDKVYYGKNGTYCSYVGYGFVKPAGGRCMYETITKRAQEECEDCGNRYDGEWVGKDFCLNPGTLAMISVVGWIIVLAKIFIPFLIIGFGTLDLYKIVMSGETAQAKKSAISFGQRLVLGIFIFFLPTLVNAFIGYLLPKDYSACATCMFSPTKCDGASIDESIKNK